MRNDLYELNVPTSVAAGTEHKGPRNLLHKTYQVAGTFDATFRLQGTLDGSTWFDLTADLTAASVGAIVTLTDSKGAEYALQAMRVNTTAFVSGVPRVFVGGFLHRP